MRFPLLLLAGLLLAAPAAGQEVPAVPPAPAPQAPAAAPPAGAPVPVGEAPKPLAQPAGAPASAAPVAALGPQPLPPASLERPVEPPGKVGPILLIIGGAAGILAGVTNLASAGVCPKVASSSRGACFAASLASGVVLVGAGAPVLAVGVGQRRARLKWEEGVRVGVAVAPVEGGALVAGRWSW